METITVHVKHGPQDHQVALPATATVQQLKQELEPLTGLVKRQQKLIFKGKVLEDSSALTACKLVNGSKVMLLAAQVSVCDPQRCGITYMALECYGSNT